MEAKPNPLKLAYSATFPGGPEARLRDHAIVVGIALVVSVLFGLAASIYIVTTVQDSVKRDAIHAATTNCNNLRLSRIAGNQFRFAVREELAFIPDLVAFSKASKQKPTPEGAAFLAAEVTRLNRDLAAESRTIPGLPTRVSGFQDLFPLLADTPLLDCSSASLTR